MTNIFALHEIMYDSLRKNRAGVVLKLDFEKAYGKVHWGFLMRCLKIRGFDEKWCSWIEKVTYDGTVAMKVNGFVGPYFQSCKGVRQGTLYLPCCSILLLIA
jgi:hypothetical protein